MSKQMNYGKRFRNQGIATVSHHGLPRVVKPRPPWAQHRPPRRQLIIQASKLDARNRLRLGKVKITLPKVSCLEKTDDLC